MAPGDVSDALPAASSAAPVTPQRPEQQQQPQPAAASASGPAAVDGTSSTGSGPKTVAEYLAAYPHLTDLDRHILQLPSDAHFTPHSWADLHRLIGANHLHLLTRSPSQTRAYLDWTSAIRRQFGSITAYLLAERLRWTPLPDAGGPVFAFRDPTPFADPDDYLVLRNDWPYGLDPGIVHICVWLKTPLALKPDDGDLTSDARALVEAFVTSTFREPLGEGPKGERVLWFKNWAKLQSVRGVDHVHVLVKDALPEQLRRWMK